MDLPEVEQKALRDWMTACWPDEGCGLIVDGRFYGLPNRAERPRGSYRIAASDITRIRDVHGAIQGIVHSHPDGWACPSSLDMERQAEWDVPFGIIVSHESGCEAPVWFGRQVARPALVGRGFRHGITDCKSLIDDWFAHHRGVQLLDQPRDWEWWANGGNLYQDCFARAGFTDIAEADLQPGDCVLFAIRSRVPNHAAVFLEGEKVIHHPSGRHPVDPNMLSRVDHYQRWRGHAVRWARHVR